MLCENCNQEHSGSYGSGRFCSTKCARSFSTKDSKGTFKSVKCIICDEIFKIPINARRNNFKCKNCKKSKRKLLLEKNTKCLWHLCNNNHSKNSFWCSQKCRHTHTIQKRRDAFKKRAIDYKGGCCSICGYSKCIKALEFHHLRDKVFGISNGAYSKSWKNVKIELDKCILVCANCHRELHFLSALPD